MPRLCRIPTVFCLVLAGISTGCAVFHEEVPSIMPLSSPGAPATGPVERIVSGSVRAPVNGGGSTMTVDPALVGGLGNASAITIASTRGIAVIPGVAIDWNRIKDLPIERRSDFFGAVDTTLAQLENAEINARFTLPKPGMETAHQQYLKSLQEEIADLNRQRADMEFVAPDRWENAKEIFNESWLDTQSAFSRSAATSR